MFDHTALEPLLDRVVHSIHSTYPDHHNPDDTKQELWLYIYQNTDSIEKIYRTANEPEGVLYNYLVGEAEKFLKKEDAVAYGYRAEDTFLYPLKVVRELLDNVFTYDDWQPTGDTSDGQPKAKTQVNQGGTYVAMLCDVKVAFKKLNKNQQELLLWVYRDHFDDEMVADSLGITAIAARDRRNRAVKAIQKSLGTKPLSDLRRGFTGRQTPGKAQAQAIVEHDYEG